MILLQRFLVSSWQKKLITVKISLDKSENKISINNVEFFDKEQGKENW